MYRWPLAVAACALGACAPRRPPAEPPAVPKDAAVEPAPGINRGLTTRERALVGPLFAGSIDLEIVHVVQDKYVPFQGDDTYMTPENDIYAPGLLFADDFAAPMADPYDLAIFIHEMTHVWQHQNGLDLIAAGAIAFAALGGEYDRAYAYALDPARDLTDYGVEQQASIVEDWFLITGFYLPPVSLVESPLDPDDRDGLYRKVLGAFLADPHYARAVAPDELLRRHASAVRATPPEPTDEEP